MTICTYQLCGRNQTFQHCVTISEIQRQAIAVLKIVPGWALRRRAQNSKKTGEIARQRLQPPELIPKKRASKQTTTPPSTSSHPRPEILTNPVPRSHPHESPRRNPSTQCTSTSRQTARPTPGAHTRMEGLAGLAAAQAGCTAASSVSADGHSATR